ncbi:uncharacterized protein LOC103580610 isoform X2 [Microplitis demolitor]|uniref:uncharacterized protein LOC103580610 isoform X2 n=1 Tax=Microplitis demolitor TaxID=69319 RepID=UPI00235B6D04|nr:uncharacterized protein LOC103580610 isoform X2 [Microplitis demolitor]
MGMEYGDTDKTTAVTTYNPNVEQFIRREQDRRVVQEGTAMWRRRKEEILRQKHHEQRQLRHLQATYSPWGKPGGGAFCESALKKKNVVLEPISPPRSYQGWTTKSFITRMCNNEIDPLALTSSEKLFDSKSRPGITRSPRSSPPPLALPSPRQVYSRPYTSIDVPNDGNKNTQDYELTGGVELVPLLTARKCHSHPIKYIITDATRPGYTIDRYRSLNIENRDYTAALSEQISRKRQRILEEKRLEQESCRRHFDTWRKFWGRPGHGAPIDHAYRNDLHAILYRPAVY